MDGIHDLGGKQGFGKIRRPWLEAEEPWEPLVRATMGYAAGTLGIFNIDEFRHAIERIAARDYVTFGYYERHATAIATLMVEKGFVTRAQLEEAAGGRFPLAEPAGPGRMPDPAPERQIGDRARVKVQYVPGHCRMPAYIRGKIGTVVGVSPPCHYPDAAGHGLHAPMQVNYHMAFKAQDLWGDDCDPSTVHVSVFQSYLESPDD